MMALEVILVGAAGIEPDLLSTESVACGISEFICSHINLYKGDDVCYYVMLMDIGVFHLFIPNLVEDIFQSQVLYHYWIQ
jgi:hypothetical protein